MLGRINYDAENQRISIVEEVDLFQKGKKYFYEYILLHEEVSN